MEKLDLIFRFGDRKKKLTIEVPEHLSRHRLVLINDLIRKHKELQGYNSLFVHSNAKLLYKLSPRFVNAPVNLSIVGVGYVGLVTAVGLCHRGRRVICVDIDENKIRKIANRRAPIYEEGLQDLLEKLPDEMFNCMTSLKDAVMNSDATFIAVGTPSTETGNQYLGYLEQVARQLGAILKHKKGHIVVVKSTVLPGTTEGLVKRLISENAGHSDFRIAMVPEFLREGLALKDFLYPFRIVIGVGNDEDYEAIRFIYKEFDTVFYKTNIKTAEMIKYASNCLLATKISFANEIGNMCKKLGIDVYEVMDGVGLDKRINRSFLNAGRGFGGSCFPKDVKALIQLGKKLRVRPLLLEAVWRVNEEQPKKLVELAKKRVGVLKGKRVAVLGLAFKPGTDDIRESPAITVIKELLKEGAEVIAYDPAAERNMAKLFPNLAYSPNFDDAISNADVVIGVTEWPELRNEQLFKGKIFIDGMKFLNKRTGKNYEGICW